MKKISEESIEVSEMKSENLMADKEGIYENYQQIKEYESHFNNLETDIRKLDSLVFSSCKTN